MLPCMLGQSSTTVRSTTQALYNVSLAHVLDVATKSPTYHQVALQSLIWPRNDIRVIVVGNGLQQEYKEDA